MCNEDFCNDLEYDLHSERAKRLFGLNRNRNAVTGGYSFFVNTSRLVKEEKDDRNVVLVSEEAVIGAVSSEEDEEVIESRHLKRVPRQTGSGRHRQKTLF